MASRGVVCVEIPDKVKWRETTDIRARIYLRYVVQYSAILCCYRARGHATCFRRVLTLLWFHSVGWQAEFRVRKKMYCSCAHVQIPMSPESQTYTVAPKRISEVEVAVEACLPLSIQIDCVVQADMRHQLRPWKRRRWHTSVRRWRREEKMTRNFFLI